MNLDDQGSLHKYRVRAQWLIIIVLCLLGGWMMLSNRIERAAQATMRQAPSPDGVWQWLDANAQSLTTNIVLSTARVSQLNREALTQVLASAPLETTAPLSESKATLTLPMPDGTFARFRIQQSPIMEPALAAQFPDIKTYHGQGIDDPAATTRFDWTPQGFHATILSPHGNVSISPADNLTRYVTFFVRDLPADAAQFRCLVTENLNQMSNQLVPPTSDFTSGATLRTYRLAVATTGEYTQLYGGGTVAGGVAAVTTAVNSFNSLFEKEVSIRLILIANEAAIIFTNAATDGYTSGNLNSLLNENQAKLDSVIGASNYDIGHIFDGQSGGSGFGASGQAFFGTCVGNVKAKGGIIFTNLPPTNPYTAHAMAHEMGHQFGAAHTFNGTSATCGNTGQRNAPTAYEPGSGSTIMAYGGLCGLESLPNQDTYYHTGSLAQIIAWSTTGSGGGACPGQLLTNNRPPTVDAGPDFTIPKGTPFKLTATASDPDGDALTYNWEELDAAVAPGPPNNDADGLARPIFRSYPPTDSTTRLFPSLPYILNNANAPPTFPFTGEVLPAITRTMNFQMTARDNRAGGGGVATDVMQVNVRSESGPFLVTQPNTAWTGGATQTVTWSVNNTNLAPINCANVKITLSLDGGNTFPITLAESTPNDGSQAITVPNSLFSNTARIQVEAVGNIFFDLSDANFTLLPGGGCAGISALSTTVGNIGSSVTITGIGFTSVNAVRFSNNASATFNVVNDTTITTTVPSGATSGPITVSKPGCGDVQTASFILCPSAPTTLLVDDGRSESFFGFNTGGDTFYVNRLTPTSYPATINRVSAFFNTSIPIGTNVGIVVGTNADGDGNIDNISFQTLNTTVTAQNQFNDYFVAPVTITSGDFVVGFRIAPLSNVFPASVDRSSPSQMRSYMSFDGIIFQTLEVSAPQFAGNLLVRAQVYTGACGNVTCNYSLNATSQSFPTSGGSGNVSVTTSNGCAWTATSNASWLTITSGGSGSSNGAVSYTVAANTDGNARTGTLTVAGQTVTVTQPGVFASVSAASYLTTSLAPDEIVSAFGVNLATTFEAAISLPLPTVLAGTQIKVKDSAGVTRDAPLFAVSSTQVNYLIPTGTAPGPATITLTSGNGNIVTQTVQITNASPGLFAANASGQGLANAVAVHVTTDGRQISEPVAVFDPAQAKFIARPIDLGPEGEIVVLLLYGTGVRYRSDLSNVIVTIGNQRQQVDYAGVQPDFTGLDQLNVRLSRELIGRGEIDIGLVVDGRTANIVKINIK